MKFAKELEQDLVPEWRIKYLNYKAGKKYVKSVARAIKTANVTPKNALGRSAKRESPTVFRGRDDQSDEEGSEDGDAWAPTPAPIHEDGERLSLTRSPRSDNANNYGSVLTTQPSHASHRSSHTFQLPGPAIQEPAVSNESTDPPKKSTLSRLQLSHRSVSEVPVTISKQPSYLGGTLLPSKGTPPSGRLRRLFSHDQRLPHKSDSSYSLQAIDTVRQREREFFDFLDSELDKVETFYRQKELQAGQRLEVLREQLHEMRNRRTHEIAELRRHKQNKADAANNNNDNNNKNGGATAQGHSSGFEHHAAWIDPIRSKLFKPGPNSKALAKMPQTPVFSPRGSGGDAGRDYTRRSPEHDVAYRTAKRKLKLALQEFYRGLELLKSYALLNRTAFRKLNKKYDKAVNARPPLRYMNQKVNKAWFVTSDVIDGQLHAVEDLYARYFEKGNHKVAAGKLRRMTRQTRDESGIAFRNGLLVGIAAVFAIEAVIYGGKLLFDPDPTLAQQTSYLLQIYGGYFLMLTLFTMFCLNCYIWTANKINYHFIFEFDPRHQLDWRQLAVFPSFFFLLFAVIFWLNFSRFGEAHVLWLWWPVILIGLSLIILLLPAPVFWHRSRRWFAYSHYRLFFAGLYPVEFRDFFLGDIYCSLTYAMCNIELFFCLYAHSWNNPPQCNSSHSRLLGFFYALPPIWRALQCIRRYYDTRQSFPHLVNCGKYGMTILAAVFLSIYRLHDSPAHLALFITFSVLNSIYTSVWDLFMDFSLLQRDARYTLLRDILGLKRRWVYYLIMTIDPILRFGWLPYAIFTHDSQHSSLVSFVVSLLEVSRRGMWTLIRVENEHCTNVAQYKASRDVPLPYRLSSGSSGRTSADVPVQKTPGGTQTAAGRAADVPTVAVDHAAGSTTGKAQNQEISSETAAESRSSPSTARKQEQQPEVEDSGLRRRTRRPSTSGSGMIRGARSIRDIMAMAHRQDFEKKRRPPAAAAVVGAADEIEEEEEEDVDDDDDEDETGSLVEERNEVKCVQSLVRGDDSDDERGA